MNVINSFVFSFMESSAAPTTLILNTMILRMMSVTLIKVVLFLH